MLLARTAVVCDEYMMKEMSNLASGELDGPGPLDLESGGSDDACVAALDLRRVEESDKAGVVDLVSDQNVVKMPGNLPPTLGVAMSFAGMISDDSKYTGFPEIGVPPNHPCQTDFHDLGYHHFSKPLHSVYLFECSLFPCFDATEATSIILNPGYTSRIV